MIKQLILFFSLFLLSCGDKSIISSPMLWEVTGKGLTKPSYLFGTYHSSDEKINNLPKVVYSTLKEADRFYTEIKMSNKNTKKVSSYSKLPHAKPLKQRLHPKVYKKLLKFLIKNRVPLTLKKLSSYKTWSISLMIANHSASKNNLPFMDERLVLYAKKHHIKQSGLESVLEQLTYFDALPKRLQEQLLLDSMAQKDDLGYTNALEAWYTNGEAKGFEALQKQFASSDPQQQKLDKVLFDGLLIQRNVRFTRRIDVLLKSRPQHSYFFAIGAGHFADKKSILTGLKKLGYTVRKIN
jgi:uncharacterized protein YbaP (TraB family)